MKNNMKWIAVCCMTVFSIGFYSCNKEYVDLEYKGNIDLNQLNLVQAREVWNGTECNINVPELKYDPEKTSENYSYALSAALYQERVAGQENTVDLIIDADSLNTAIAKSLEGGLYAKYVDVELLPEEFYQLSADKLTLFAGNVFSEEASLLIFSQNLVDYIQKELKQSKTYVLPVRIVNSTFYQINSKVNTLMYFITVTYVKEEEEGPEYFPVTDVPEIGDAYGETDLKLVWHDEFNGTGAPDLEKWRFEEGFQRNEELQWYSDQNAVCQDGALVITGKRQRVDNPNYEEGSSDWKKNREYAEYTSSSIVSKFRFRYGTMEVRAKIPTTRGAWPAIWTTGISNDSWCWEWPLGGEIDLLEYYLVSGTPSIHANACWGSDTRWSAKWDSYNRPLSDFTNKDSKWASKYHVWRMDWDDQYIKLYLDGELMNEIDLNNTSNGSGGLNDWWRGSWRNPFRDAGNSGDGGLGQQIFLNLAMGGNGGAPDLSNLPMEYHIDYVRVYQKAE